MSEARVLDGRYRLVREIASGGMGVVHEAEHIALKKRVAVKLLRREIADLPGVAARFEREARATSLLDDPNIVRVTDFGRTTEGELYLVMELLKGRSLASLLSEIPQLPTERALAITEQVLAGLEVAHSHGLIHRDLKPDNIFISPSPRGELVRVLDFGLAAARRDAEGTKLTVAGTVMGTPAYMSPEQAMGRPDLDGRTDIHAVGAILYEMLAGRPTFAGENYNQVLYAVVLGEYASLSSLRNDLPASLCAVVTRALAKDPHERFENVSAMREALGMPVGSMFRLPDQSTPAMAAVAPGFHMPQQLDVTDLLGDSVAARPASGVEPIFGPPADSLQIEPVSRPMTEAPKFAAMQVQPLELERQPPKPVIVEPERAPFPIARVASIVALLAVVGGGGFVAYKHFLAPHDATIELTRVPPDAKLILDGNPIVGQRLVLPISNEVHELKVVSGFRPPHMIHFSAKDGDQSIDVTAEHR